MMRAKAKEAYSMGKPTGFLEYPRRPVPYRDPSDRIKDFKEIYTPADARALSIQGARCMDCGIPFCQSNNGCPIGNLIPEWNDLVYKGRWKDAYHQLSLTNNFPEFTGRTCPAPCEGACVLGITDPAVTIKNIENAIIDKAFERGWVSHARELPLSTKKVAIIGSGPCGLTAADQLNRAGHEVTVFERSDRIGGLLMYGIPNMKLEKELVERRVNMMTQAGIQFNCNQNIGSTPESLEQLNTYDAVLIAIGSTRARTLPVSGADANGIHLAMEFLSKNTKSYIETNLEDNAFISAKGKRVVVIGGGDTGADCIGTSIRHGCKSIVNLELLDRPPAGRVEGNPWPLWPKIFRLDYAHEEAEVSFGGDPREFAVITKEFLKDDSGQVTAIKTARIKWEKGENGFKMNEIPGSESLIEADLVFLALGFVGPENYLTQGLKVSHASNDLIDAAHGKFQTNISNIFSAGDCRRGQSLVVWAINEGRGAAKAIDQYLMGTTSLHAPVASSI